ncbi:hypothetical protein FHG71_22360, partial [Rubellimicrobium roseum]
MEWCAPKRGRPGRSETFSDAAIPFCLSSKILFGLALRQIEPWGAMGSSPMARRAGGEPGSKMAGLGWPVPDFSTLCRMQKTVRIQIPFRCAGALLRNSGVGRVSPFPLRFSRRGR